MLSDNSILNQRDLEGHQIGRNDLKMFKQQYADKLEGFKAQNTDLINRISKLSNELEEDKTVFKSLALKEFKINGEKQLICGLGIRVGTSLSYDEDDALVWAHKHLLCLKLDGRAFDKLAKTQEFTFVTKEERITVTFPKEIIIENKTK